MSIASIESTALWADIKDVMNAKVNPTRFDYRGLLHTEKEDLTILKIVAIDIVRDYVNAVGDLIHIEFKMPLGEYMIRLYPFRTNLEVTLKRTALTDNNAKIDGSKIITTRYKAVFLTEENPNLTGKEHEQHDIATLNNAEIVTVKLQLLNRSLEFLRIRMAQGVFRNVTQKQLIHTVLGGESSKVLIDGKPAIDGMNIVEPDNQEVRKNTIIPSSTVITSIPSYLQEKSGGVYSTGIGTYLQFFNKRLLWFIYPTWNTKRFVKSKDDSIIFYALPEGRFQGLDRTYFKNASIVKALITGKRRYTDSADIDYMNQGSGFRMADAKAFMKKPVAITENGPMAKRLNLNTEVAAESRKDGMNYAPRVSSSSNPFKEYSRINGRNIAQIDVVWENCDPELIYPGMPCKYVFLDEGRTVELNGTVGHVQASTQVLGVGITSNSYITNSVVTLLCEQKPMTRKLPTQSPTGARY